MDSNMDALNTRNGNTNYYAHPGPARKKNKFYCWIISGIFSVPGFGHVVITVN